MKYDNRFVIVIDDLSEFLGSKDVLLLKEDMLQLSYGKYIIDVGYYNKAFILYIIKNYDWDNPYLKKLIYNEETLIAEINNACRKVLEIN